MRRTATKVLVLAMLLVLTAAASPSLAAQAVTLASARKPARHTAAKTSRHTSTRTAAHSSGHAAACAPARAAGHSKTRVRHQACAAASEIRPEPRAHTRRASVSRIAPHHHVPDAPPAITETDATANPSSAPPPASDPAAAEAGADSGKTESEPVASEQSSTAPLSLQPASFSRKSGPMPPPLRGSLASLERQNERADADGLERIEDEDDLSDRIAHKLLVPVPISEALAINPDLPDHHRYCRPWTARFLSDLARAQSAQFHAPLEVTSAVRTVAWQKRLIGINGNAAPAEGDIVSPHLTGATIDIAKSGLTRQQIGWMRSWLLPLQTAGKIDVEEEFQQSCFHITVYKSYVPRRPAPSIAHDKPSPQKPTPKSRQLNRDIAAAAPTLGR
jgi:hypothetical protein